MWVRTWVGGLGRHLVASRGWVVWVIIQTGPAFVARPEEVVLALPLLTPNEAGAPCWPHLGYRTSKKNKARGSLVYQPILVWVGRGGVYQHRARGTLVYPPIFVWARWNVFFSNSHINKK